MVLDYILSIHNKKSKSADGYEYESTIEIDLIARYLLETNSLFGGIVMYDSDDTKRFELPWLINKSAKLYNDSIDISVSDLTFVIENTNLGTITLNPNNKPYESNIFDFKPNTIFAGNVTNQYSQDFSYNQIITYKILYQGIEYENYNNYIAINILNSYSNPLIINQLVRIDKTYQRYVNVDLNQQVITDETYTTIDIVDIVGPFNGSFTKETIIENNIEIERIRYTPNDNYKGSDFIFFVTIIMFKM